MRRLRLPRIDAGHLSQLAGIVAAVVVAVLLNVLVERRFTRWDWTSNQRYSLSPATVQTLRGLPDTVQIWVLVGSADPLEGSLKLLLTAYRAETSKLDVHYIDPDHDAIALEDVRKRFKIETGRTEQGHVVADSVVVVARGDRRWFLGAKDMVELAAGDDTRVRPKEEQALTAAIRSVLGGDKARLCFTAGHGEMSPLDPGDHGAAQLKEVLEKDNYEVAVVDTGAPGSAEPFKGCSVAVIAGLRGAFTREEAERLRTFLLGGGNLLLAASPIPGDTQTGLVPAGLERALAPFGVVLDDDVVLELDPEVAFPGEAGSRFVALPAQHPITAGLVKADTHREVPRVVVGFARSMRKWAPQNARADARSDAGGASAQAILGTSDRAIGLTNVVGAAEWKEPPGKRPGDLGGPLVLGMASERPKLAPSAPRGPRLVVLGTASVLTSGTFREPLPVRGAALLVESAISWLASKPQILDVPDKAAVPAGIKMSEASRAELRRYVLLFMPGAFALAGVLVALARRAEPKKAAGKKKPRGEQR